MLFNIFKKKCDHDYQVMIYYSMNNQLYQCSKCSSLLYQDISEQFSTVDPNDIKRIRTELIDVLGKPEELLMKKTKEFQRIVSSKEDLSGFIKQQVMASKKGDLSD